MVGLWFGIPEGSGKASARGTFVGGDSWNMDGVWMAGSWFAAVGGSVDRRAGLVVVVAEGGQAVVAALLGAEVVAEAKRRLVAP